MLSEEQMKDYLAWCYQLASHSKDPSTQNGAILLDLTSENTGVIGRGINRFPNGVLDIPSRYERPLKYKIIEHAERNAVYDAARAGYKIAGSTMVCAWAACCDCARAIIQTGVKTLVRHKQAGDRSTGIWLEEITIADQMLHEAGIEIIDFDGELNAGVAVLQSGKLWRP